MTLSGTSTPLTLFSERLPMRSYLPNFYHFSLSFSTWHYTTWQCLPFLNLRKSVFSWFSETVASWFSCYCFDCSSALSWPLVHLDQKRGNPHGFCSLRVPWHSIFCSLPMSFMPVLVFPDSAFSAMSPFLSVRSNFPQCSWYTSNSICQRDLYQPKPVTIRCPS